MQTLLLDLPQFTGLKTFKKNVDKIYDFDSHAGI